MNKSRVNSDIFEETNGQLLQIQNPPLNTNEISKLDSSLENSASKPEYPEHEPNQAILAFDLRKRMKVM